MVDDMKCEICGANDADYRCAKCGKSVCYNCARKVGDQIICSQCAKPVVQQPQEKKSNGLAKAIMTVAILLAGMLAILYVLDYYVGGLSSAVGADLLMVSSLKDMAVLMTEGMGALLALLVIIYIATRLKKPAKSL